MVFEARIARALNRALGDRLHGLDKSNVRLSLLEGEVALQKVRVKSTALRGMKGIDANVKVKAGYVGELRIKFRGENWGRNRGSDVRSVQQRNFGETMMMRTTTRRNLMMKGGGDVGKRTERNETKVRGEEREERKRNKREETKRGGKFERRWLKGDSTPGAEELTQKF